MAARRALKSLALAALVVGLSFVAANSSRGQEAEARAVRIFDHYVGLLGDCDRGARLDNFAIELQNSPETTGYILIYSGKYDLPKRAWAYRQSTQDYLVNTRAIDAGRFRIVDAGYKQELTTEIWIMPKGADAPRPSETIDTARELDHAFKFDETSVSLPYEENHTVEDSEVIEEAADETLTAEENAEEALPVEAQAGDDAAEKDLSAQGEEISEEVVEPSEEANEADADAWWGLKFYADALRIEEKARGHIIFYANREDGIVGRTQAVIQQGMSQLSEKYGIKAGRLALVFGGYRQYPTAELWIVPVNVSLPVPTPEPEEKDAAEAAPQNQATAGLLIAP